MSRIARVLSLAVFLFGMYVGKDILPFTYSAQEPIDQKVLTGIYDPSFENGEFHEHTAVSSFLPSHFAYANVLGSSSEEKRIEVDLTNQRLYAFEGNRRVYNFLVSTGLWGKTPTGNFRIWVKLKYTRMRGGNSALGTYYDLPNVPYTMYFTNDQIPRSRGYGLHGTYWHNNFGHPMSHGCVNMRTSEAEQIFNWATPIGSGWGVNATAENPGTLITIYGTAPAS
ncbi:L,D-transpeptidase [Candidatus Gottesmanbacteria bacterium]|nr:L,D-transpeptidase [Candidatus Gottesmanbacteria bacterium]